MYGELQVSSARAHELAISAKDASHAAANRTEETEARGISPPRCRDGDEAQPACAPSRRRDVPLRPARIERRPQGGTFSISTGAPGVECRPGKRGLLERMDANELRALQSPLKARYREQPGAALITLCAIGSLGAEAVACKVETGRALVTAGLHPATGGDGSLACSGDMLLEALVACGGVTLRAVATSLSIPIQVGTVTAEGALDFG